MDALVDCEMEVYLQREKNGKQSTTEQLVRNERVEVGIDERVIQNVVFNNNVHYNIMSTK